MQRRGLIHIAGWSPWADFSFIEIRDVHLACLHAFLASLLLKKPNIFFSSLHEFIFSVIDTSCLFYRQI